MSSVRVGQVWRSKDPRDYGRTVEVLEVDPYPNGFVTVKSVRRSAIRAHYFEKRYELVRDVPGSAA